MTQHTCSNCGAVFEDEDFCPRCGQWVDAPVSGHEEFALGEPPADEGHRHTVPYQTTPCPSCGAANPATNRHCEECGARLSQGALPVAPQPMIQSTPGVRAAMAIGAVLVVVVLLALVFNLFSGGEPEADPGLDPTATSTTTAAVTQSPLEKIPVLNSTCSSELNENFGCDKMFDDDPTTAWNDASLSGENASITVTFADTYQLEQIVIYNLDDQTRFLRNYRIAGYKITTDDNAQGIIEILDNAPGAQFIDFVSLRTTQVTIEVQSTHPAEDVDDLAAFDELVVQEIEFIGRKVEN